MDTKYTNRSRIAKGVCYLTFSNFDNIFVFNIFQVSGIRNKRTGIRGPRTGIRVQGTGIREQGSGNRDQGTGIRDQATGNCELLTVK